MKYILLLRIKKKIPKCPKLPIKSQVAPVHSRALEHSIDILRYINVVLLLLLYIYIYIYIYIDYRQSMVIS